jgi:glycosyltransferase involved in cell wall biosynthesis
MIRIGFCTNTLRPAHGVTHWLKTLCKAAAGRLELSGLLFTANYGDIDAAALNWFPRASCFVAPDAVQRFPEAVSSHQVQRFQHPQAAFYAFSDSCDLILSWINLYDIHERTTKPLVLVNHHGGWHSPPEWNGGIFTHFAAVSQYAAELLHVRHKHRVQVIYPGVDTERLQTVVGGAAAWRQRWGLDESHLIVMSLGRASADKNPRELAKAAATNGPAWRAVYVGDLPDVRGWSPLEKSRVIHQPFQEQLGDIITAANVIAVPSAKEACCQAIFEAWYLGVPVVGTQVGAIAELGQLDGFYPLVLSVDEQAKSFQRLLNEAVARRPVKEQQLVRENFTDRHMAKGWLDYLTQILDPAAAASPSVTSDKSVVALEKNAWLRPAAVCGPVTTPVADAKSLPNYARPKQQRIGLLVNLLTNGGGEQFLLNLLKFSSLEFSGLALVDDGYSDPLIRRQVERYLPVFAGPGYPHKPNYDPELKRYTHDSQAIQQLVDRSDLILSQGLQGLERQLAQYQGPLVVAMLSHGGEACHRGIVTSARLKNAQVVAGSEMVARLTCRPEDRPVVILNGIDPEHCAPRQPGPEIRQELGLRREDIVVGYLGRLAPEKYAIAAALAVSRLPAAYKCLYVVEGQQGYATQELIKIRELAENRLVQVPWRARVGDLMSAVDCGICCSHHEGNSLMLLNYFYRGIPVVSTRVGALPELERDYGKLAITTGPSPDAFTMSRAVRKALHPAHQVTVTKARQLVRSKFLAEHMARDWDLLLRRVLRTWASR